MTSSQRHPMADTQQASNVDYDNAELMGEPSSAHAEYTKYASATGDWGAQQLGGMKIRVSES